MNSNPALDRIVQSYGDLLFDLCESVLWSPINAQLAFRAIIKDIRKATASRDHQTYERAWVLHLACGRLESFAQRHARRLTASEQLELDSSPSVASRLKQLDQYFHRLRTEDQILLLLKDKYGLPYSEIASAFEAPADSLKVRRQQALRALEEWLWDSADAAPGSRDCFSWQTRTSDYLDGTLAPADKQECDHHVDGCKLCNERNKHFRLLLTSIASQPRSSLPVPIRKSPMTAALPRLDMAAVGRSRWEMLPWYVRTTAEATGIVLVILGAIILTPKIRTLYERGMELRLSELNDMFRKNDESAGESLVAENIPVVRGKLGVAAENAKDFETEGVEDTGSEEVQDDPKETVLVETSDGNIRVGNSEIWRFSVKTDSPQDVRRKVVEMLTSLKIPTDLPGLGGTEAPGGIQFDLLLPKAAIPHIKTKLQKLAPTAPSELKGTPASETFTWYKTRSKRPIPSGKSRVVIWVSRQI